MMKRLCALALSLPLRIMLGSSNRRGSRRWRLDSRLCNKAITQEHNGFFSAVSLSQLTQDYDDQLNRLRHPV